MSRSWAERWRIGLAPDGAELLRVSWRGRTTQSLRVPCEPQPGQAAWTTALAALDQALGDAGARGGAAGVVLSNHFVRYLVLPWQPELNSARELGGLAQLRFKAVYGDAAAAWTVRCSEGGWGQPSVACAVDTELLAALRAALEARGLRLASMQPLLMAVFNDLRRKFAGDAAFAIVEPGRLCLALMQQGAFDAIVSRRTPADAAQAIEQELATLPPRADGAALELQRIGDAPAWPAGAARAVREWAVRPLAACGVA